MDVATGGGGMARVVRGTVVTMAFFILAAYFLWMAWPLLPILCVMMPLSMLIPSRGWTRARAVSLTVGCLLITTSSAGIVRFRQVNDAPWARFAVIMGGVVALVAAASVIEWRRRDPAPPAAAEPVGGPA